jgi:hypothetical protein
MRLYGGILIELKARKILTTNDSPIGGYGESLVVCRGFGDHYSSDTSPVYPIGGTLAKCDPFGTPSTSHWTGAAIIV